MSNDYQDQYFQLTPQQDKEVRKSLRQQRHEGAGQLIYDGDDLTGMNWSTKDVQWCAEVLSWSKFDMSYDEYKYNYMNVLYDSYGGKKNTPKDERRELRYQINHDWKELEKDYLYRLARMSMGQFIEQGFTDFEGAMRSQFQKICKYTLTAKSIKHGYTSDSVDKINYGFERIAADGGPISNAAATAKYSSGYDLPFDETFFDFHKFYNQDVKALSHLAD